MAFFAGGCLSFILLFIFLVVTAGEVGFFIGLEATRWIVPCGLVIFIVYLILQKKKAEKLTSNSKCNQDD